MPLRPSPALDVDPYAISEHRHRFAVWAASRAAQRGLRGATNLTCTKALEGCGVSDLVVASVETWPATDATFDALHHSWCESIIASLQQSGVKEATFGRASKLIAIYLKTTVVLAGHENTQFAHVLHPPIDEILLKTLAKQAEFGNALTRWRSITWTTLDQPSYADLIRSLRRAWKDRGPFWMIEQHWRGV